MKVTIVTIFDLIDEGWSNHDWIDNVLRDHLSFSYTPKITINLLIGVENIPLIVAHDTDYLSRTTTLNSNIPSTSSHSHEESFFFLCSVPLMVALILIHLASICLQHHYNTILKFNYSYYPTRSTSNFSLPNKYWLISPRRGTRRIK